jgi:hypothetical protein
MNFRSVLLLTLLLASLAAQTTRDSGEVMRKLQYDKAVASYVGKISASIAEQLLKNSDFEKLAATPVAILPIVDLYDANETSLATIKINENLIHEMFIRGFKIVDVKGDMSGCVLFGTFTNYKDGMTINERIVDKKSGVVYSTAQVFISKKELKSINKIYNKYDWFSQ